MVEKRGFWANKPIILITVMLALGLIVSVPDAGVIVAFVLSTAVALLARKQGSLKDLGFHAIESWRSLLTTTFLYGLVLQFLLLVVINPGLGRLTGVPLDVSNFDAVRGNPVNFLVLLIIGWVVGGFFEEFVFRGFIVGRLSWLLGSRVAATWVAVFLAAISFGLAHSYQGVTGMVSTGLTGFVFGCVFVVHRYNLWYSIFTHGFSNTFGIAAIYLSLDQRLESLLWN